MIKQVRTSDWNRKHVETHTRIMPGVYYGTNWDIRGRGRLLLIRLPLGYGLNIGTGFSGFISLRPWEWARYDYADHFSLFERSRWMRRPHGKH
jgi:hypothetical protein